VLRRFSQFFAAALTIASVCTAQIAPPPPLPPRGSVDAGKEPRLKKRVAIMPPVVGRLAAELQLAPEVVARIARDATETAFSAAPGLLLVNRSDLSDVLAEQQLGQSALFNSELAPKTGYLIPAQALIYVTIQDVYLKELRTTQSSSMAGELLRQAEALETQARQLQDQAAAQSSAMQRSALGGFDPANYGQMNCTAIYNCSQYSDPAYVQFCEGQVRQCDSQNQLRLQQAQENENQRRANESSQIDALRNQSRALMNQAQSLRAQAQMGQQEAYDEIRRTVDIQLVWRVVDTMTGEVMATGDLTESSSLSNTTAAKQTGFDRYSQARITSHNSIIQDALSRATVRLVRDVTNAIATEPFRAKVAEFDPSSGKVFINAGSSHGLLRGDTFGVLETGRILTDPDTGQILRRPGKPVGMIWVESVLGPSLSSATAIRIVDELTRGSELQYLGSFPAGPPAQ
jgi:hypothetical protein